MAARKETVFGRLLVWLEHLASRRLGALVVFGIGLAVYAVRAIAWPLKTGRDLDEYLYAYVQLFDRHVLLPWSLLFRTPITPLVAGAALDVLDGRLAEPLMAVLYAGSIVCWAAAARFFGPRAAIAVAVALLAYTGYALMFHELSSEPVFAAAFAGWAWLVTRATFAPSAGRFALVGLGVAVLALVRPGNAVLLAFAIVPLLLAGSRRVRFERTGAFLLAAVLPLLAWSVHNGIRFDSWGLARGGNAIVPFYRAFITDNIVSPENGEQSRRLALAMQQHLLTREPYRSYKVTLDDLFERGSFRVHEDLYLLSDQVFGWDTDYSVLRSAGIEGVRAHPGTYARGVTRTVWDELAKAQFRVASAKRAAGGSESSKPATVVIGGKRLPEPSEGEPIPAGQVVWISRPDQSIRQVWTSPTEWHFEFDHPGDRPRFEQITGDVNAPVRRSPQPHRQRAARAPAQPALALVPAAVDVDPARPGRRRRASTTRLAAAGRAVARSVRRRAPERPRPVRRPPLRVAGGPCVPPPRLGRAAWRADASRR